MKNQKGITLVSLSIYVVGITIIVGIVATITSFFYSNTQSINESASSLGEFNKFNLEMIREVKLDGNEVSRISEDQHRIVFTSGTVFTFSDKGIYKNKVKICSEITDCRFSKTMQEEKEIITVFFSMKNFAKTMEYVINNKVVANANMEKNYTQVVSKQYVQDGLLLHYDGINNTGEGHSDSTTVWKDLSINNNDGIVHNIIWSENGAVFNGDNSWINCGQINSDYLSFVITFSINDLPGRAQCLIANWEIKGAGVYVKSNGHFAGDYYLNGAYRTIQSNSALELRSIYQAAITYDGTNRVMYINGIKVTDEVISPQSAIEPPTSNTVMMMGSNPSGQNPVNQFFNGKVYSVAVYGRALTSDEIKQNYQVDKLKYEIPD